MNIFLYVSIRTTATYEFDKIRTAGATGNTTNYKNSQGDNPICSTRDEISQPSRPISPRAATVDNDMSNFTELCTGISLFLLSASEFHNKRYSSVLVAQVNLVELQRFGKNEFASCVHETFLFIEYI